jgi:3-phosphoshikimate 1-carboxyvinyltransferase
MKAFDFKGPIASSKSYFNRALILSHYKKDLVLYGNSQSLDVVNLQKALLTVQAQEGKGEVYVGSGGTTLRFLSFLISRIPGQWKLVGEPRLFERPQQPLQTLLQYFGVDVEFGPHFLEIESKGWCKPQGSIPLDLTQSTQFASGLILNAWNLPFPIELSESAEKVSDGYLEMTLDLVQKSGMKISRQGPQMTIGEGQQISVSEIKVEPDLSSAFVVASLAACRGHCEIQDFPFSSLQPDLLFVRLFEKMNVPLETRGSTLVVDRAFDLRPLEVSLRQAPDLFPVLAVLLTRAKGTSRIYNIPQLRFKESDRLSRTCELLHHMKVPFEAGDAELKIMSRGRHHHQFFEFNPDQDHRLAFAAALARSMGYRMKILDPEVVNKSFPGFWNLIGGGPG